MHTSSTAIYISSRTWNGNLAVDVLAHDVDVVLEDGADGDHRRVIRNGAGHKLADLLVLHHRLIVLDQVNLLRC